MTVKLVRSPCGQAVDQRDIGIVQPGADQLARVSVLPDARSPRAGGMLMANTMHLTVGWTSAD
jgi:hypothetical protein